jgi:hypothetical protein
MNDDREKNKFYFLFKESLAIIISLVALIISIKSCTLSKQSMEITNRPYLSLKPVKFGKSDFYLNITDNPSKLSLSVETTFEIMNPGKTPATDIQCPEHATGILQNLTTPNIQSSEMPVHFTPCQNTSIGPGESHYIVLDMTVENINRNDFRTDLEFFNSGKGFIVWKIPISYSSIIDPSKHYNTEVSYKVFKDRIVFVESIVK